MQCLSECYVNDSEMNMAITIIYHIIVFFS